jgi:quinol monooxygenase YgiN
MIHVIATIQLAAGRQADFLKEFHAVMPHVRAEQGCLEYGPAVDLQTSIQAQPAARADVVTVVEKWEDVEALEAHLVAPHMLQYRGRIKELVQGVELRILQPV